MFILPVWFVAIAIVIWLEHRSNTEHMTQALLTAACGPDPLIGLRKNRP